MFTRSSVQQLFPALVWSQQVEPERAAVIDALLLDGVRRMRAGGAGSAPGVAWQSRNNLQDNPALAPVVEMARAGADKVLDFLAVASRDIAVTGMWLNINPPGAPHVMHNHPNNYLAGTYYVRAGAGADHIQFHDFRLQTQAILPRFSRETPYNSATHRVTVQPGLLILFPAWLPHSVGPNASAEDRISLSFNINFRNFTETLSPPSWQPDA
ncbi:MAG: TIGR02466 family protein [Alphaproteobacteria bacterium]